MANEAIKKRLGNNGEGSKETLSENAQRLRNDKEWRNSELSRAQDVITNRKEQGLDTSAQQKYIETINRLNSQGQKQQPASQPYNKGNAGLYGNDGKGYDKDTYSNHQNQLKTDKNYWQSEIQRTQQVIQNRATQGMDVSKQQKYLGELQQYADDHKNQTQERVNEWMDGYEDRFQGSVDEMEEFIQGGSDAWLKQQKASLDEARDQKVAEIKQAYDQAVSEGKLSVREAKEQFEANVQEINKQHYQQTEVTNQVAQNRGLQNSQQMVGMMQGDNARKNTMINQNMSERDSRINKIKDRIKDITMQKDLDIANANSSYENSVLNAEGQASQMFNENMLNMSQQQLQQMQQMYANMMNTGMQNDFNRENMTYENMLKNEQMRQQQGYQQENAERQQEFDLEKMDVQQRNTLEQMAKSFGYDLQKMSKQQQYQLDQMARSFDYDISKMNLQQDFDLEKMDVTQRNQLEQMAKAFGYDLSKMSKQQQYDLAQMAQQFNNNWKLNDQQFGHQSALSEQSYNQAIKKAEQQSALAMKEEAIAYDRATERELAKYQPGTQEYRIAKERREREKSSYLEKKQSDFMFDALSSTLFSGEDVNEDNISKAIKSYKNYLDMAGIGDDPKKSNTILDDWNRLYGVSSGMGKRSAPVAGASTNHQGTDFKMPANTTIPSTVSGTVISAGKDTDTPSYGNSIRIKDANGNVHIFAHLNGVSVKKGDRVAVGQNIGKTGNTGRSSGAHLHYEVRKGNTYGNAYNPFKYFN